MANKTPAKGARAYPPPASKEDADKLLGEIGAAARALEQLELEAEDEIAATKAHYATQAAPHEETIKIKMAALWRWAVDNRGKEFPKDKKSLDLAQGVIGFRATPTKVEIDEELEKAVIKALLRRKLKHMVRIKVEPDLQAIKKEPGRVEGIAGITFVDGENFFAEPIDVDVEKVKLTKKVPARRGAAEKQAA